MIKNQSNISDQVEYIFGDVWHVFAFLLYLFCFDLLWLFCEKHSFESFYIFGQFLAEFLNVTLHQKLELESACLLLN